MSDAQPPQKAPAAPLSAGRSEADVYAIWGAEPEVNAYAMAKYSRSSLSMRESLRELDGQRAEKFLNTFYFQYGHRSIADLAHLSLAVERLSILGAIEVADETRWDGQERSTRYQAFRKTGWYTPASLAAAERAAYDAGMQTLFNEYEGLTARMIEALRPRAPKPAEMPQDAYERTLRARAFDISRYLLPLATITSLGQIVSARTLEQQISRLLSSSYQEVRELGEALRRAASEPAYDLRSQRSERLLAAVRAAQAAGAASAADLADAEAATRAVRGAPTLVKYTAVNEYAVTTGAELRQLAASLVGAITPDHTAGVQLSEALPLEIEIPATLLYAHTHHSFRQVADAVAALPAARRQEITRLGTAHRGRHDELLREFQSGQTFCFDILMDLGGFRDMHRHRRCVQIAQDYTGQHGYDVPDLVTEAGEEARFRVVVERAVALGAAGAPELAAYWLPLACRKRCLFKMDFAELAYISELRTGPAGHISYRRVAWEMLEQVRQRHPELAALVRATDPSEPIDLLQR